MTFPNAKVDKFCELAKISTDITRLNAVENEWQQVFYLFKFQNLIVSY